MSEKGRIETVAVHAGRSIDPATGAVTPAIHPSTTFERDPDGSYPRGHLYARNSNPTRSALEECLRQLDGGAAAAAFASGSAATSAIFFALTATPVIAPTDTYYGTQRLLREQFGPWGLEYTLVDMTEPAQVEAAMRPSTRLVWVETPSNPLWKITDIARLVAIAHGAGARCVCDNTTATPALQRPLAFGADLAMSPPRSSSACSDSSAGPGGADDDFWARWPASSGGGAVPRRSTAARPARSHPALPHARHCDNAMQVASFLSTTRPGGRAHRARQPSRPPRAREQ
jgi:cystathionine gamma-synthase